MADLAETERHREWLWRVKYDLDFAEMEQVSMRSIRVFTAVKNVVY